MEATVLTRRIQVLRRVPRFRRRGARTWSVLVVIPGGGRRLTDTGMLGNNDIVLGREGDKMTPLPL